MSRAVVHAFEVDLLDCRVGAVDSGLPESAPGCGDAQHAAAGGFESRARPAVFRRGRPWRRGFRLDAADRLAGFESARDIRPTPAPRRRDGPAFHSQRSCRRGARARRPEDCARRSPSMRCIRGCVSGIAQADVELEHLRSVGGHHQTGIEKAGETAWLRPPDGSRVSMICRRLRLA